VIKLFYQSKNGKGNMKNLVIFILVALMFIACSEDNPVEPQEMSLVDILTQDGHWVGTIELTDTTYIYQYLSFYDESTGKEENLFMESSWLMYQINVDFEWSIIKESGDTFIKFTYLNDWSPKYKAIEDVDSNEMTMILGGVWYRFVSN